MTRSKSPLNPHKVSPPGGTPEPRALPVVSIDQALEEFLLRIPSLTVGGPYRVPIEELRNKKSMRYAEWGNSSGVYFFEQDARIFYIGRALPGSGLRSRVHSQCTAYGDPSWDAVILKDETQVGVITVERKDWYWAAALEPFLIERVTPSHNRRAC